MLVINSVTKNHSSNLHVVWDKRVRSFHMLLYDKMNQLSHLKMYLIWQLLQNNAYNITLAPWYTSIVCLNLIWLIINCPYLCTLYINRDALITSHLINILILFLLSMIKLTWLHHICKNEWNIFSVPIYVQYINRDSVNIFGTTWRKVTRKKSGTPYINYRWSELVS